jgi:hypothetical protein
MCRIAGSSLVLKLLHFLANVTRIDGPNGGDNEILAPQASISQPHRNSREGWFIAVIFGNPETTELFSQLALYRHSTHHPAKRRRKSGHLVNRRLQQLNTSTQARLGTLSKGVRPDPLL